jgi:poly-gamma-glutamate synthase PgsB/CapB
MFDLGSSDDIVLVVIMGVLLFLLAAGVKEHLPHRRNVQAIPLRISVNGSRGKSTVTRLLTGAIAAGGYRPLGKTTGTEARLIRGWDLEEEEIPRRPEGPNIGEQREMMRRAATEDADAVVAECMAVTPEYQLTFHRRMLDVNLLVIANALEDHLEEMGPTAADVAEVFSATIPSDGTLALVPGPHLERFLTVARERNAAVVIGDPNGVDDALLRSFDHLVLAEHVALTLAVTRHLGIPDDVAIGGMRAAPPDPFATRLLPIGNPDDPALFVNAFPANDPESTLGVWRHVLDRGHPEEGLVVIMNCREDRIARTQQFADDVLPALPIDTLVVTGHSTRAVVRASQDGRIDARETIDLTGRDPQAIADALEGRLDGRVVLGVGNLHGGGREIIAHLEQLRVRRLTERGAA